MECSVKKLCIFSCGYGFLIGKKCYFLFTSGNVVKISGRFRGGFGVKFCKITKMQKIFQGYLCNAKKTCELKKKYVFFVEIFKAIHYNIILYVAYNAHHCGKAIK